MRLALICLLAVCAAPAIAETPYCGADAVARAGGLLKLHWNSDGVVLAEEPGPPLDTGAAQAWSIDDVATVAGTVKALAGDGAFDVLEVGSGNAGRDVLNGGAGVDTLTGGVGADTFVARLADATDAPDVIVDYADGIDRIVIDLPPDVMGEAVIFGPARTQNAALWQDALSGNLLFDADGTGNQAALTLLILRGDVQVDLGDITFL